MKRKSSLISRAVAFALCLCIIGGGIGSGSVARATSGTPARVKISSVKPAKNKIKIKWKKAKQAKKYQVYIKTGKKKYKKVKTTTKQSCTFSGRYQTTYAVKVRAVNGKKTGRFSKVAKARTKKPNIKNSKEAVAYAKYFYKLKGRSTEGLLFTYDHKSNGRYVIHIYYDMFDHTATMAWWGITKSGGVYDEIMGNWIKK